MGKSVNKVQIIGNLCRDPEMRAMPNGTAVASISVATDESYNDKTTGQKVEQTEWHRVTVYGKLAEICGQYLKKGSRAYFEGKLRTREWEKDGVKRYTTEIVANDMMMLDRSGDSHGQQQWYQPAQQTHQQPAQQPYHPAPTTYPPQQPYQPAAAPNQYQQSQAPQNGFDDFEDDVPFN